MISVAFEAEMMVGAWYVPDESDIIPVAGHVVGHLYKSAKKLKVLEKVINRVTEVGEIALAAAKRKRLANGESGNIVIRITNDVEKEGRFGHTPSGSQLGEDAVEDALDAKETCWFDQFCLVAGTPVTMGDGSLKSVGTLLAVSTVSFRDDVSRSCNAVKGHSKQCPYAFQTASEVD